MRCFAILPFVVFTIVARQGVAQEEKVSRDFRTEWLVLDHNEYRKFSGDRVHTVFFSLDAAKYKGDFLRISDDEPFGIFINKKLIAAKDQGEVKLKMDSLRLLYASPWSISIFQRRGISSISCTLVSPAAVKPVLDDSDLHLRAGNFFLDFALTGALIVSIFLVFLMGTNPRLAFDYLNPSKLFSVQEREETLLANRVTSRVNLLFYLFCSLYCSLTLLVIFHLANDRIPLAQYFPIRSVGEGFLQWLKLSGLVAGVLVIKMVIVGIFSSLFNIRDGAAIQHFHFIRALLLSAGLITGISVLNFIFKGPYGGLQFVLLRMGAVVLVLSAGMMYLKLLGLTRYHFFHLFSYLCASEIIPLVVLLKVLLY